MVVTRHAGSGSRSGSGAREGGQGGSVLPEVVDQMSTGKLDARIREILHDEVAALFRAELPELFGSIKTTMVEYFDERYASLIETAAATATTAVTAAGRGAGRGRVFLRALKLVSDKTKKNTEGAYVQGMTTSSAGSMTPRSPLMTPKTSQVVLLLAGKGAYSEHDDLPQMNELADIARCAGNTPLDDDRSLSYLLTCLDDLRVVIDRRKFDALTVETFGARIEKFIREKYLHMCEMVDDEKVDIASTVIDEDAPLEDDVVRSLRTNPIHSGNKDRTSIDDFEIIKPISHGAFGRVLKKADIIRKNAVESILAERDILIPVLNPFVVRFFYSFTCRENLYLVMEYLNGGDLYSLLRNLGCLDEDVARIYIAEVICFYFHFISYQDIVLALEYLHSLRVVHLPVIVASTAPFDKQPGVDVSEEEFLQFDTTAIPVIVTLNKVSLNSNVVLIFMLYQGAANIKVAGTDMNNKSSRSHSVFTCWFSKRSSIAINQLKFRSPMM
uniref:non-specific serine/threonine protein kinase n=1 Tax=Lactuca sativa TaxID=4236 RepID=A0A9R1UKJ2_LACSA|nr:hypothetical protein LSAT_V11C900501560 [Lactuca sativa]